MRWLLITLAFVTAGCAVQAPPAQPDWRTLPAQAVAGGEHLIVAVALDDPDGLAAMAAALEADHPMSLVAEWPLRSIDLHCFVFRVDDGLDEATVLRELGADARVRIAQPMNAFRTLSTEYDDDLFELQGALREIDVLPLHSVATGRGVTIGVVDTRPDVNHPDLAARVSLSRDFVKDGSSALAEEHGTAIAGVIGADGSNSRGIVGVAPGAEIVALRACWQERRSGVGSCSSFSLAQAINFALLNRIDILNLSLGGPPDALLGELLTAALDRGVIVVAASGAGSSATFPASLDRVIAVSAHATAGVADLGSQTALLAPGIDVLSTAPNARYDFFSGSSVAAAHISGVAALLRELRPSLEANEMARLLRGSSDRTDGQSVVNGCAALREIAPQSAAQSCGR
ncbi:MAG: S8 family serine peptidase [Pseudomonadota bacterium]